MRSQIWFWQYLFYLTVDAYSRRVSRRRSRRYPVQSLVTSGLAAELSFRFPLFVPDAVIIRTYTARLFDHSDIYTGGLYLGASVSTWDATARAWGARIPREAYRTASRFKNRATTINASDITQKGREITSTFERGKKKREREKEKRDTEKHWFFSTFFLSVLLSSLPPSHSLFLVFMAPKPSTDPWHHSYTFRQQDSRRERAQ